MKNFLRVVLLTIMLVLTTGIAKAQEYTFEEINIKESMLYSNAPCTVTQYGDDFKGWHVLFDGNPTTIFHSEYGSGTSTDGLDHYWRVDMGKDNRLSTFKFKIQTRDKNSEVNSPTTIVVEGSNEDGGRGTYTEIKTITGITQQNSTWYESDVLGQHGIKYRYIRFRVTATGYNQTDGGGKKFFFISEFRMSKAIAPVRSDYVHNTGNIVDNRAEGSKRKLNLFKLTDGTNSLEVTNIQETYTSAVYSDKTESKLSTYAGATLSFSAFSYAGSWMHAYAYVDYDKDCYFTLAKNNDGTTEGEIVSYNYYNGKTITGDTGDENGNALSNEYNGSKAMPAFTLPANLKPGEYRMRIKVDWDNLDADYGASSIAQNSGCQCDITLVIKEKYTVTVTAGEGGTATASAAEVAEGNNVTLTATADSDHRFVGWYDGETKVSEDNPYTFPVTDNINYEARFGEPFPDGAYKIYWQADNRGYLAYYSGRQDEAVLADVTLGTHGGNHYTSTTEGVDLVWYLITASDGKRYLFHAATGRFLGANPSVNSNGIVNKLSTTEAWPIAVEENTHPERLGHYIITTVINNTKNLICSGCGTSSFNGGHSVRWLPVNDANQKDGGAPLQLVKVDDVTVADNVIAFARNVINGNVQTISSCDEFLNNFTNGKIYYFETSRGVLAALQEGNNLVSTARQNIVENPGMNNPYCQWTVYRSDDNKYYLYNIGKRMFMGTTTTNNGAIPFTEKPINDGLVFTAATKNGYPIMFTCNTNTGAVNHSTSTNHEYGLVYWEAGWDKLNDDGNCHKVTLIGELDNSTLDAIADAVAKVNTEISYKVDVEDWTQENPNTHFGGITFNCGGVEKKITLTTANFETNKIKADVSGEVSLSHSRKYRGFNFVGFSIDGNDLGKTPNLTDEQKNKLTNGTPLIAKFKTDGTDDVTLFYDDDAFSYRIPAIAKTGTNRLVAISDYRHNLDDIGRDNHGTGKRRIDLVMRTSDDNGATWSDIKTIAAGDDSKDGSYLRAFGDAAVAAVGENIVVMAAAGDVQYGSGTTDNPNRMARIYSTDNGATWAIEEMTTKMYSQSTSLIPSGGSAFFGSGKLAVDPNFNDTGKARIYGALLVRIKNNDGSYSNYNNFAVYSDDLGANWHILGGSQDAIAGGDEPKVEILPNGQILLSARRGGGRVFRVFTYGDDKANGAGSWGDAAVNGCNNGGSNATNGEIICLDAKHPNGTPTKILLQSQPKGGSGQYDRKDVTIWYKEVSSDETYTSATIASGWTMGKQVSTQLSAYSAMCLQANGEIAFFFEEAPCYGDDNTKGYSMVYVPLTIEEITGENFLSPNATATATTVKIKLTDTEGNEYNDELDILNKNLNNIDAIAAKLIEKYPFITLGANGKLTVSDNVYTYTNTVTLPFKVSNANTTVWHNIYWPSYNPSSGKIGCPIYLSATESNSNVPKVKADALYGASEYNTLDWADRLSWAVYSVNNSLTFKFKNKSADKYIQVTSVASGDAQNTVYADEADATVFTLLKDTGTRNGDYALAAKVDETVGYLCSTSASYDWATHFEHTRHEGAWVKFVEAPDYQGIVDKLIADIDNFGTGEGKYVANDAISNINKDALATMPLNSLNAHKETVQTVKDSYSEITLTVPAVNDVVPGSVKILEEAVSHKFVPKGEVTIEAVPAGGFRFVNWTRPAAAASAAARTAEARNSDVVSSDNPYTVTVSEALSLEANFEEILVNVTLTDAQGNTYIVQLDGFTNGVTKETVAAKLVEKYPYITLGTADGGITLEGGDAAYTYTNTVELPFKVTNTTYIWHNIYWPSNTKAYDYPIYWSASSAEDTYVPKVTDNCAYGAHSTYNTKDGNDKISWAIYNVDNSFKFIFKNKVTQKYIKVTSVAEGNAQNVVYVENAEDATAFTIEKKPAGNEYDTPAQYSLAAYVGETKGYLCSSSAGYGYATHHKSNGHQGAWIEFVESPDYFTKIMDIGIILGLKFGAGDGKCIITEDIQEIIDAMQNSGSITLNNLTEYASRQEDAMNNWPAISLTINPEDCGTTSINGEENVKHKYIPNGYELALVATPAEGYHFDKWIDGTSEITTAEYTKTISGGKGDVIELTVNFAKNSYYRIGYDFNSNRYYIQSEASGVSGKKNALKMTQETGAASIFYYAEKKLLSYDKGTYVKEDGTTRGLQAVGTSGTVTITTTGETSTIAAPSYMHANSVTSGTNTTYFIDHCGSNTGTDAHANHNFVLEEVTTLPVTISSALHATFYAPVAVAVPEGVKAYVLKEKNITTDTWVTMTLLQNRIIPANTGVILKSEEAKTYDFIITENTDEARLEAEGNILEGTVAKSSVNKDAYILTKKSNGVGMYPLSNNSYLTDGTTPATFTNNSHKAYLPVEGNFAKLLQQGTGFRFTFDDGNATEVEDIETEVEDTIYDLQGRKLSEITKPGIYIVNGKKVWIK